MLDDAVEAAVGGAHDAAVAARVVEHRAQKGCSTRCRAVLGDEFGEGVGVEHRHVAADDNHLAGEVCGQSGERDLDGSPGAWYLVLIDDRGLWHELGDHANDPVTLVPHDRDDLCRLERASGRQHVTDERNTSERMQHLRLRGFHARAGASREHDDYELCVNHAPIVAHVMRISATRRSRPLLCQ